MAHVSTNIRLDRELLRQLKRAALEQDRSLASVAREAFVRYLGLPMPEDEARLAARQRRAIVAWGTYRGPVAHPKVSHDEVLYGKYAPKLRDRGPKSARVSARGAEEVPKRSEADHRRKRAR